MILEITTLGAGTFDVTLPCKTFDLVNMMLRNDDQFLEFKYPADKGGVPIILNKTNIVSIKAKR